VFISFSSFLNFTFFFVAGETGRDFVEFIVKICAPPEREKSAATDDLAIEGRVADPHSFQPDPDPAFEADYQSRIQIQSGSRALMTNN
jgi:hypothetical protein